MPTLIQKQRELFDRGFVVKSNAGTGILRYTDADAIKSFINTCLIEHYEEDIRELEGLKTDERKVAIFGDWEARTYEEKMLVNSALSLVISQLQDKIKELKK